MSRYARVLDRLRNPTSDMPVPEAEFPVDVSPHPVDTSIPPCHQHWREELRRLRGIIVLANQLHGVQTILICGTRQDDGASSVAGHLAVALAEIGRGRIAFADGRGTTSNGAHPLDAALVGSDRKMGVAASSSLCVRRTRIANLEVVASRHNGDSVMTLLQPADLVRRLRKQFSYIILSAPPVIAHPDTLLLATKVDGVILIAAAHRTRLDDLEAAKTELEHVGANILGVVLNAYQEILPRVLRHH